LYNALIVSFDVSSLERWHSLEKRNEKHLFLTPGLARFGKTNWFGKTKKLNL